MKEDLIVQHATVLIAKLTKRETERDRSSWEASGTLGAAQNLMYCAELTPEGVRQIADAIRERDEATLLALARLLAYVCCCSYPYGPHTLECMNTNHRLRGAEAPTR